MYKNCLILIFALFLGSNTLNAKNEPGNGIDNPAYLIHLDKSFYVNGEVIWYKLLLPDDNLHRAAAIKVVLTNRNGKTIFYTFLKNQENPYVAGYYKVPFDLPTGMYRLSFLASDSNTGQTYSLAYTNLPIYNDNEPIDAAKVRNDVFQKAALLLPLNSDALEVQIDLSTDTIRSRNQMLATITVTDATGRPIDAQISVAVSDQELANLSGSAWPTVVSGSTPPLRQSLDKEITVKAKLSDFNDRPLTANVLGVLAPEQNRIFYTRTLAPGQVNLRLPDFYSEQPIQFLGFPQEEDSIKVSLLPDEKLAAEGEVIYTPEIVEYLDLSRQRKKIYQLYTDLEFNLQPQLPAIVPQELKPGRTVKVKDYESFDNAYLFFKEILTPLVFRQVKGEIFEAKVYTDKGNRVYEMLSGSPLFIIDGQATRDGNYVAHMKMDMVESVEIFTDRAELRQQFNVMGSSGVVIIKTSSSDITVPDADAENIKKVQGLQAPVVFPAYSQELFNSDRHRPFFRPQLYWNPDLKSSAAGKAVTSFYQSDATGNFQVRVLVQDKQGRVGYAEKTYHATW